MFRIEIKTDEVAKILGLTPDGARRNLRGLRIAYNKPKTSKISIADFCKYFDLSHKEVFCQVNKLKSHEYDKLVEEGVIIIPDVIVE